MEQAAMEEGVQRSDKVLVIVSEKYFDSEFCMKELRWAKQYSIEHSIEPHDCPTEHSIRQVYEGNRGRYPCQSQRKNR